MHLRPTIFHSVTSSHQVPIPNNVSTSHHFPTSHHAYTPPCLYIPSCPYSKSCLYIPSCPVICRHCNQHMKYSGGTTNMATYLRRHHTIIIPGSGSDSSSPGIPTAALKPKTPMPVILWVLVDLYLFIFNIVKFLYCLHRYKHRYKNQAGLWVILSQRMQQVDNRYICLQRSTGGWDANWGCLSTNARGLSISRQDLNKLLKCDI